MYVLRRASASFFPSFFRFVFMELLLLRARLFELQQWSLLLMILCLYVWFFPVIFLNAITNNITV
jgi:hypothetical protein